MESSFIELAKPYGTSTNYYIVNASLNIELNVDVNIVPDDSNVPYPSYNIIKMWCLAPSTFRAYDDGVVDLTDNGEYREWNMTACNVILSSDDRYYLYARLNRKTNVGDYIFSKNLYNTDGSYFDYDLNETKAASDQYFYFELTTGKGFSLNEAEENGQTVKYRSGFVDTGRLGVAPGLIEDVADAKSRFNSSFELVFEGEDNTRPSAIKFKVPVSGETKFNGLASFMGGLSILKGKVFSLFGVSIKNILTSVSSNPDTPDDSAIVSQGFLIKGFFSWIKEKLGAVFLSKQKDDYTPFSITVGKNLNINGAAVLDGGAKVRQGLSTDTLTASDSIATTTATVSKKAKIATTITDAVSSPDFIEGINIGKGFSMTNVNGLSKLQIDEISVRKKAFFSQLDIAKLSSVGGNVVLSATASTIREVVSNENAFRIFLTADDGTMATQNSWDTGDIVRCQTFNIDEKTNYNARNKNYYCRVTGTGSNENGQYIDVLQLLVDGSVGIPEVGDIIVQMGNVDPSKTERQNIIILSSTGNNAPSLVQYSGVNDTDISNFAGTMMSPNGNVFRAKSFEFSNDNKVVVKIPRDLGEYDPSATYDYYDRVSLGGSLWLCVNKKGNVTSLPTTGNADWLEQVKKGKDGADGGTYSCILETPSFIVPLNTDGSVPDGYIKSIKYHIYHAGTEVSSDFVPNISYVSNAYAAVDRGATEIIISDFEGSGNCSIEFRSTEGTQVLKASVYFELVKGGVSPVNLSSVVENFVWTLLPNENLSSVPTLTTAVRLCRGTTNISLDSNVSWNVVAEGCTATVTKKNEEMILSVSDIKTNNGKVNVTASVGNSKYQKELTVSIIKNARGVTSVTKLYALNNSVATPPSSAWSTDVLLPNKQNKILWTKERTSYSDFSSSETEPYIASFFAEDGTSAYAAYLSMSSAQVTPFYNYADKKITVVPYLTFGTKLLKLSKDNVQVSYDEDKCAVTIDEDGYVTIATIKNLSQSSSVIITINYDSFSVSLPFSYVVVNTGVKTIEDNNGSVMYAEYVDADNNPHSAKVGTIIDSDGAAVVQLTGEQIDLRGTTTINNENGDGVRIEADGTLYAKNANIQGTLMAGSSIITKFKRIYLGDTGEIVNETNNKMEMVSTEDSTVRLYITSDGFVNFTSEFINEIVMLPSDAAYIGQRVLLCHSKPSQIESNGTDSCPATLVVASQKNASQGGILDNGHHYGFRFRYGLVELLGIPTPNAKPECQWVVVSQNAEFKFEDASYDESL